MTVTALNVGVLDLQGAVSEHVRAAERAMANLRVKGCVRRVKYAEEMGGLTHLIMGGGESTAISKLMAREGIDAAIKRAAEKNGLKIFGTCAGAILLARRVEGLSAGQKTLGLMDVRMRRNAFGRQAESCERRIGTSLGDVDAIFIRAPSILEVGRGVEVLAQTRDGDILAAQQENRFLVTVFHPELGGSTEFHEHFLKLF